MLLSGKTALVTGASKGVDKGIPVGLARQACDDAINYNSDANGAAATCAEIRGMGGGRSHCRPTSSSAPIVNIASGCN